MIPTVYILHTVATASSHRHLADNILIVLPFYPGSQLNRGPEDGFNSISPDVSKHCLRVLADAINTIVIDGNYHQLSSDCEMLRIS